MCAETKENATNLKQTKWKHIIQVKFYLFKQQTSTQSMRILTAR